MLPGEDGRKGCRAAVHDFLRIPLLVYSAANREKFQVAARVKPESFCEVQMDTYLRASAFRQQLEEYKQQLGGGGDGPQVGDPRACCVGMNGTGMGTVVTGCEHAVGIIRVRGWLLIVLMWHCLPALV